MVTFKVYCVKLSYPLENCKLHVVGMVGILFLIDSTSLG